MPPMTDKDFQETKQALKDYGEWLKTASKEEVLEFLKSTGRYDNLIEKTEKKDMIPNFFCDSDLRYNYHDLMCEHARGYREAKAEYKKKIKKLKAKIKLLKVKP